MFGMLVDTHGAIELDRVHRFTNDWERAAAALSSAGLTVVDPRSPEAVAWVSVVGDGLTEEASVLRDFASSTMSASGTPRSCR